MMADVPPDAVLSPATTGEQDRGTAGQRRINLLWERSQATVAISVVITALVVASTISLVAVLSADPGERQMAFAMTAFLFLSNITMTVIGFYFGRTNHTRTGGSGQPSGETR